MKAVFGFILGLLVVALLSHSTYAAGEGCELRASLLNQDPYPAVPGEYVKVVFQLNGTNDPDCHNILFELIPQYPFSLDPGKNSSATALGGAYARDFQSYLIVPYDVRIDKDAIDGANPIEVRYTSSKGDEYFNVAKFDIEIQDLRGDFEVSIRDYDPTTNTLTFDILNIGKYDVEAVTVEVPKQNNVVIKGANRNIVGSLDANEDTTFSFEASPSVGQLKMIIYYTDKINVRRTIEKEVSFDPDYFTGRKTESQSTPWYFYVIGLIILIVVIWFIRRRMTRKRTMHHKKDF